MPTSMIRVPENLLIDFTGKKDVNIRILEEKLKIEIRMKGNELSLISLDDTQLELSLKIINGMIKMIKEGVIFSIQDFENILIRFTEKGRFKEDFFYYHPVVKTFLSKNIGCKTLGQLKYVKAMERKRLVICDGPAGTGKTFLAVAYAIKMLREEKIERIVLVRPAIEAGENLGFLPGTYMEKIDPYFKPLYDALLHVLGAQKVEKYITHKIVEVAPLAYMRGRTLNNSFIILDEAQNTTFNQLKMFLTRIGIGSHTVITGDNTQIDLPQSARPGLKETKQILHGIDEVEFIDLDYRDIVRDSLVQKIILAYDNFNKNSRNKSK